MYAISAKAPQGLWKFKQGSAILDPIAIGHLPDCSYAQRIFIRKEISISPSDNYRIQNCKMAFIKLLQVLAFSPLFRKFVDNGNFRTDT
jgi:hypothetical protein